MPPRRRPSVDLMQTRAFMYEDISCSILPRVEQLWNFLQKKSLVLGDYRIIGPAANLLVRPISDPTKLRPP